MKDKIKFSFITDCPIPFRKSVKKHGTGLITIEQYSKIMEILNL